MPVKINGLPAHVLLVHLVVVLLPVAAVMLVLSAVWPAARAKLGFLSPACALIALILVPITTHAGEWLEDHLGFHSKAIEHHADLGGELLPWAIGIFVMSAAVWVLGRWYGLPGLTGHRTPAESSAPANTSDDHVAGGASGGVATRTRPVAAATRTLPVWVAAVVAVLSIAVAVGGSVQLYRIGDSGAQAVWKGVGSQNGS